MSKFFTDFTDGQGYRQIVTEEEGPDCTSTIYVKITHPECQWEFISMMDVSMWRTVVADADTLIAFWNLMRRAVRQLNNHGGPQNAIAFFTQGEAGNSEPREERANAVLQVYEN